MGPSHSLPPKKEFALDLLERSSVHMHLDPRASGVVVPPWLKKQPQIVLQVGRNMPVPIPDLQVDDDGLSCTLSFNRSPFFCVVPWPSVFAMVGDDGRGMVWPDDVPPEVMRQVQVREVPRPDAAPKRTLEAVRDTPAPSAAPSKGRKGKKKAPASDGRTPVATALSRDKESASPRAVPTPVGPRAVPNPAQRKPKRELPPYLRVVK